MNTDPKTWSVLLQRVEQVRRAQSEGNVYPHKSLVLAWAFYEHYRSGLRQWPISHVLGETERLLDLFGQRVDGAHNPVWRLRNDGLCEISLNGNPYLPSQVSPPPRATLQDSDALWILPQMVTDLLTQNRDRLNDAFEVLIDEIPAEKRSIFMSTFHLDEQETVLGERERREEMWANILKAGGPQNLSAKTVREFGLISGAAGITRDLRSTGHLRPDGVTVGILLTGKKYEDDLDDEGVIYHYPRTNRPGSTDQSEIEATKNASRLGLPIFTVIKNGGTRNVRLSRVTLWDDEQEVFLVEFEDEWRTVWHFELDTADDENPSERVSRKMRTTRTTARDSRFSLRIKRAYGLGCAVCEQRIPSLIQGAHLISHSDGGKDAVGNGLPLCANHHLAMDNQLWAVNPQTFDLTFHIPKEKLGITRDSIAHLDRMPDSKCLEYVWDKFHATAAK